MEKVNIRSDLSIGDQKVGGKMNTNGLWTISEISICGKPTEVALAELREAMLEGNKIVDEANKGREPIKKKTTKKTTPKPDEKSEEKPEETKKTKSKNKKLETDPAPIEDNKEPEMIDSFFFNNRTQCNQSRTQKEHRQ